VIAASSMISYIVLHGRNQSNPDALNKIFNLIHIARYQELQALLLLVEYNTIQTVLKLRRNPATSNVTNALASINGRE
jgi:hypothetical protein